MFYTTYTNYTHQSRYLHVSTVLGGSSLNTGNSGDSGACTAPRDPGTGPPDTTLPLLLPPVSRTSQWSEADELVEPKQRNEKSLLHCSPIISMHIKRRRPTTAPLEEAILHQDGNRSVIVGYYLFSSFRENRH